MKLTGWILVYVLMQAGSARAANCCTFPTYEKPTFSYLTAPRSFGASRANGRAHAACDLYQTKSGQGVRAVQDGTILRDKYYFYQGTYAIEVKHASGFVARYGEVTGRSVAGVTKGTKISQGDLIGYVGRVNSGCCEPMLHFEKYRGTLVGALTQVNNRPFQRRRDLENPTVELGAWEKNSFPPLPLPVSLVASPPALPMTVSENVIAAQDSFEPMIRILSEWGLGAKTDYELVDILTSLHLQPVLIRDENPETGLMSVVQTSAEDVGAQHVHAQFFGDDVNHLSLQHISFETQGTGTSLASVTQTLIANFPLLGAPEIQSTEFVRWRLPNEKVLWVKQLQYDELTESPFFLYSQQDVGSVRIAIETDPE